MAHISVVSPVYKAEAIVPLLVEQLVNSLEKITSDYEIILVEDGSPDNSWNEIVKQCIQNKKIKGIKLSRNFGQHNAIAAGLNNCSGEFIVVMDCDLQDRPEEIINLYNKIKEGYEIVLAKRHNRQDNFLKRISSKWFYAVYSYFTNTKQDETIANFGIYKKDVIKAVQLMGDYERVFPTLIQWVGYKKTNLKVVHQERIHGRSSYSFLNLFTLAFRMIISFSDRPLKVALFLGGIISLISFSFGIFYLVEAIAGNITQPGYASLIISIWFLGGVILMFIGIVGLYIGKIFEKVKNRPNFIIHQKENL